VWVQVLRRDRAARIVQRGNYVIARRALAAMAAIGLLSGCVQTTPYDVDADHSDFVKKSLAKLRAREPAPHPFRFVAISDTHDEYDDFATTIDLLNARSDLELVTHSGDISDRGLLQEMQWSFDLLERIKLPVLIALGNHDAISNGAEIWRKMFGPFDYTFEFGGLKFVFFNSNALEFPGTAPNRDWLRGQVAERGDALGVVLVSHHPMYAHDFVPGGDARAFYDELIATGAVKLWVSGHESAPKLALYRGVPLLGCGTFQDGREYFVVTVDGTEFSFERCHFDDCRPELPVELVP